MRLEDCTESDFPDVKTATLKVRHAQGGIVSWACDSGYLQRALTDQSINYLAKKKRLFAAKRSGQRSLSKLSTVEYGLLFKIKKHLF